MATPSESPLNKVIDLYRSKWHEKAEEVLAEVAVTELVRQGIISSGIGAKLLSMDRWQFTDVLAKYNVPSIEVTLEEVKEEAERLRMLRSHA